MKRIGGRQKGAKGAENVAVAIDSGKSSQHALKWAGDHILSRGQIFFLLHVRRKITSIPTPNGHQLSMPKVEKEIESALLEQIDLQTKELLLPFQCFCSRRGLQCKEVILDEINVPKAIADFVMHQAIDKLILGASSRNIFARTFKQVDVPTYVSKIAPDFCSVYVISKGKISSMRPATRPNDVHADGTVNDFVVEGNPFQSVKSDPVGTDHSEGSVRSVLVHAARVGNIGNNGSEKTNIVEVGQSIKWSNQDEGHLDYSYQSMLSCPSPSRPDVDLADNYCLLESIYYGRPQSPLPYGRHEHTNEDVPRKSSELNRDSGSHSIGAVTNGYEGSSPVPWEKTMMSNHSTETMEDKLRQLELELKKSDEMLDDTDDEIYFRKPGGQLRMGGNESRLSVAEMEQSSQALLDTEKNQVLEVMEKRKILEGFSSNIHYRRYRIEELKKASENFSNELKIGEGAYGPVYKSRLDHTLVAIKILKGEGEEGMKQFQQEVEVLSCIRHPNMVLLLGACPEYGCLVYEYMANGSLEDRLLCRSATPPLSWQLRFKIAAEITTGLLFLHQTKPEPIVHRDLKPGNILLDHNFVSKISDVGLARLIPKSVADSITQYHMTAAAGTFCYIDPEYQKTGMVSTKSDIYALGIIFLQLITGQPPMGLAHNVYNALEMGSICDLFDPKVPDWPIEETVKFAKLALKCAELRRRDRPDLGSEVLPELNQLRALAVSTEDASCSHHIQHSVSYKERVRSRGSVMSQILDNENMNYTSFII
ncbi:U-box domain-containing protein 35-like [Typha angustifolia]|uniref:U-box domain-containing protein 35-like n=1 Tax=Typha angustifolia TaxID=59011 RepID=UPI003C2D4629